MFFIALSSTIHSIQQKGVIFVDLEEMGLLSLLKERILESAHLSRLCLLPLIRNMGVGDKWR